MAFIVYCPYAGCQKPNQLGTFGGKTLHLKCAHCTGAFEFVATTTVRMATQESVANSSVSLAQSAVTQVGDAPAAPVTRVAAIKSASGFSQVSSVDAGITVTQDGQTMPTAASTPRAAPRRVGRFGIRRELGEGAFGKVYEAHDPQLDRTIALKVAKLNRDDASMRVKRFLREAKAAAGLRHPHIVPVYEFGQDEDSFYIAAAYIQGRTLEGVFPRESGTKRDIRRIARMIRQLAEALSYAHSQGIIHRDVKPANVMVDEKDEPLLMDFGLASRQEDAEQLTHEGSILGTPRYMAPEQARGRESAPLPGSDQYSLGVMLFELLTGRPPFEGSPEMVMLQHMQAEPPSPRQFRTEIPRDLETICLKSLEKDPAKRYTSCQAMADDLRRWLEGEPIQARRVGRLEKCVRWCRRNPLVAGLLTLVATLLVSGSVVSAYLAYNAEVARQQADDAALDAKRLAGIAEEKEIRARESEKEAKEKANLARENAEKARKEAERARQESLRARKVADFLVGLFDAADPIGFTGYAFGPDPKRSSVVTAKEVLDHGARKMANELKDQPEIRASLLTTIGGVYRTMGFQKEATPLLEEGLQLRLKTLGPDHVEVAQSLYQLGWMYQQDGDDPRAMDCYDRALAILVGKVDSQDLAGRCKFNKAWVLAQQFLNTEAERLFDEVLKDRLARLDRDHYDVAIARMGLASVYFQTDRGLEALPLVSEAIEALRKHHGDQSVGTAVAEGQQALWSMAVRNYDDAEKSLLKVRDIVSERLGSNHIYVAWTNGLLGHVMSRAKRWDDALRYHARCIDICKEGAGMELPLFTRALDEYADILGSRGRYEEGCKVLEDLLDRINKRRGKNHRVAMGFHKAYGIYASNYGHYDEAEKQFRAALEAAKAQPRAPFRFNSYLSNLAFAIQETKPAEAIQLFRESLAQPSEGDDRVTAKTNLADLLFRMHWYSEAAPLVKNLASETRRTPGVSREKQVVAARLEANLPALLRKEAHWHCSTLGMALSPGELTSFLAPSTGFLLQWGPELQAPIYELKPGEHFRGKLTAFDPLDRVNYGCHCQVFHIDLKANRPYHYSIATKEFPAYLRIETEHGKTLYFNLVRDKSWNDAVIYTSPWNGVHRVIVTTTDPKRMGNFALLVRDANAPVAPDPTPKVTSKPAVSIFRMKGQLTADDPIDKVRVGKFHKSYMVELKAGTTYRIDLSSKEFDSYLRIEDEAGIPIGFNDDGGGGRNARYLFTPTRTASYRIVVTTYGDRETGSFLLTVHQQ